MSDIDYEQLFKNGQLVMQEPTHLEKLDRFWQSFVGTPDEQYFKNFYRPYLEKYHPEALLPPAAPAAPEAGESTHQLSEPEMPAHNHDVPPAAEEPVNVEVPVATEEVLPIEPSPETIIATDDPTLIAKAEEITSTPPSND